ncbi:MAG: hypothetical protein IJ795_01675 [Bacteroidales bacterium]|nr:hypothetical protein [Bacteroidales bacterium]
MKRQPAQLYMAFADMRNFTSMLPEDKRQGVEADYDSLQATVQGFTIGVKVYQRQPYSLISVIDNGAPFGFKVDIHFDATPEGFTEFYINVEADLNFMMKMMLGGKIQDGLDKAVQGLADLSEGRMPEGIDPSMMPEGFDPRSMGGLF